MSLRGAVLAASLLLSVAIAQADVAVTVTGYTVSPDVFMPGDTGTISVTFKNAGTTTTALDQINYYAPQFETLTGTYQNAGSLGAGQSVTMAFTLRAPTVEGTYRSEVQIQAGGQTARFPIVLQVDGSSVEALATNVPSLIPIGGSDLTLVVANLRPNPVRSVRVTPQAPGILFTPRERYLDLLNSGNSTQVTFTATATEGGNKEIAFQITFNNGDNIHRTAAKTVSVAAEVSPTLELSLDESTRIAPGGSGQLVFHLKNQGAGTLQNIGLSWSDSANKIIPVGTTNSRYAGSLQPGGETTVTFPVASTSDASVGVYPLNVTLQYVDSARLQRALTQRIGVFVGSGTEIEVALQEVSGTTVSLLVANVGTSVAHSVVVKVPRQAGFPVTGADSAALGNLNPGDFTFATFRVGGGSASPSGGGNLSGRRGGGAQGGTAQIEVDYTDGAGARRSLQKELTLDLASPFRQNLAGDFPQRGGGGGFPLLPVLAVAAAIGAVVFWKRGAIAARLRPKKPLL